MRCIEEVRERRRQRVLNGSYIAVRVKFEQVNITVGIDMQGSTVPDNWRCSSVHHGPLCVIICTSETSDDVSTEQPGVAGCLQPKVQCLIPFR